MIALLGWARQKLSFTTPSLAYLTESAFPVYLLHQWAIVVPGYFLIRLPRGLWTKFFLLLAVSTALTIAIYHLLVRPFPVPRFLCGMKTSRSSASQRLAVGLTATGVALIAIVAIGITRPSRAAQESVASFVGHWDAEGSAAQAYLAPGRAYSSRQSTSRPAGARGAEGPCTCPRRLRWPSGLVLPFVRRRDRIR